MYVRPAYRRMGIARKLMIDLMAYCKADNRLLLTLHASDEGRPLYESLGFEETNEMRIEMDE
ncbi:Acetyltransferase (GNAT) family protein [compost metagenome]